MEFSFIVNVQVERSEGKFASRDELEEQLIEALEGADPSSVEGEAGGQYDVTDWTVEDHNLKVVKGKAKDVTDFVSAGAPPAPRVSALIKAYLQVKARPEDPIFVQDLEDALEEYTTAFPKVTAGVQAVIDHTEQQRAALAK